MPFDTDHWSYVDRHRRRRPNLREDAACAPWADQGAKAALEVADHSGHSNLSVDRPEVMKLR